MAAARGKAFDRRTQPARQAARGRLVVEMARGARMRRSGPGNDAGARKRARKKRNELGRAFDDAAARDLDHLTVQAGERDLVAYALLTPHEHALAGERLAFPSQVRKIPAQVLQIGFGLAKPPFVAAPSPI